MKRCIGGMKRGAEERKGVSEWDLPCVGVANMCVLGPANRRFLIDLRSPPPQSDQTAKCSGAGDYFHQREDVVAVAAATRAMVSELSDS